MIRFTDPWVLLLLLPLAGGLAFSARHIHGMARGRKAFALGLRFVLGALLVVALAGPENYQPHRGVATIYLVDRSDSIDQASRKEADAFLRKAFQALGPDDAAGIVAFGKEPVVDSAPAGRRDLAPIASKVDGSASDLAAAVRLASATFPDGKARRVVVLSDGNETRGDVAAAAEVAAAEELAIDFVPLGTRTESGEAMVVGLEAPRQVREDQPFQLRALVDSTTTQDAILELDREGQVVARQTVRLTEGTNAIVMPQNLDRTGFFRYRVTVRANEDRDNRNNVGLAFVGVRGKPKLLVLGGSRAGDALPSALRSRGIEVDARGPGGVPNRVEDLQAFDAVILNDFDALNLTVRQMRMIQSAVRDSGVGLAMVGGESSFLPGGYYGTPIAEALPVDLDIRQRKTFPSTSILIISDCSGSMGMTEDGVMKLRLAAKAAEETVKLMSPMDRVGVGGSTDGIEMVAPMQPASDKAKVINQIQRLAIGGGGIYIGPTVQQAEQILRAETSKVRHFILLADGADSTDWRDSIQRASAMRRDKITTTVVAIGDGKDVPMLRQLALAGGGRFYLAKKAAQLPAIFTRDAAIMSRSAIEEGAFIPKLNPAEEILRGVAADGLPPLLAYCLVDSRPLARVGMRTHKDDPLLATWQYGLGTSLAFMSDAQPRWAAQWVGWPGFDAFWSQAARAISRRATKNDYQVAVRQEGGRGVVEIRAFDTLGNPLAQTNARVRVALPDGTSADVPIQETAPGRYTGSFDATGLGSYMVSVAEPDAAGDRISVTGFSVPYPAEYRSVRANRPLLEQIAETTGGKLLQDPAEGARPVEKPGESIRELWPTLLFWAALLLPLDVATRRLALPLGEMFAKALAWFQRRRPAPVAPVPVERLQAAKARAKTGSGESVERPVVPKAPAEAPRPTPSPARSAAPANTSSQLLDAKRKRKSGD